MNKRILLIIHNQNYTGPAFKVKEMGLEISKTNKVTIFLTSRTNTFRIKKKVEDNIIIYEFPDIFRGKLRQGFDLWNALCRIIMLFFIDIDIVHAIDCRPVVIFPTLFAKYFQKKKIVISWWDLFGSDGTAYQRSGMFYSKTIGKFESIFDTSFRKIADYSIVATEFLYEKLIKLEYPESKIQIIKIGAKYPNKIQTKEECRESLMLQDDIKVFCYLGSIFKKDCNLLLNSIKIIENEGHNIKCYLIGKSGENQRGELPTSVENIGFKNSYEDILLYIGASDFGLLPFSINNANNSRWPSKIGDFLSMGKPVIATPLIEYKKIFLEHKIGILSDDDSIIAYRKSLIEAINISNIEYNKLSENCIDYFNKYLNWEMISKCTTSIYENLN